MQLIMITNDPEAAAAAEAGGVDRIMVDLEIIGKMARQGHLNTVISQHKMADIARVSARLASCELQVRVNPLGDHSVAEIDEALALGADRLMLPMFYSADEAKRFVELVDNRAVVTLLAETPEAVAAIKEVAAVPGVEEIHIGLNDLHLALGLDFMMELLSSRLLESASGVVSQQGVRLGIGGIAAIGNGDVPAEFVLPRLKQLGAGATILSRSFTACLRAGGGCLDSSVLAHEVSKLRGLWSDMDDWDAEAFEASDAEFNRRVQSVVRRIRRQPA